MFQMNSYFIKYVLNESAEVEILIFVRFRKDAVKENYCYFIFKIKFRNFVFTSFSKIYYS